MKLIVFISFFVLFSGFKSHAGLINLTILVDSSGSVYDSTYTQWNQELNTAQSLASLHKSTTHEGNFSLVNFSGCGSNYTFDTCQHRLTVEISNLDDATDFEAAIDQLGNDNFHRGYTWTNDALKVALENQAIANLPSENTQDVFVMLTDGKSTVGHETCNEQGYVSPELQYMRDNNIDLIVLGINLDQSGIDAISCMTSSDKFFLADAFHVDEADSLFSYYQETYLQEPITAVSEPSSLALATLMLFMLTSRIRQQKNNVNS